MHEIYFNRRQTYSQAQAGIFPLVFSCLPFFEDAFVSCVAWNETGSPQIAFHYSQSESILFLSPQKSERTVAPRWHALPQGFHTHQDNHCVLERIRRRKKGKEFFRSHLSEDFKLSSWGRSVCFIATIPHRVDLLIFKGLLEWFYSESKRVQWKYIEEIMFECFFFFQSLWW